MGFDVLQVRAMSMRMVAWDTGTSQNERNEMDAGEEEGDTTSSTGATGVGPHTAPEATPVPDSPSLSAQAPSSPRSSKQLPAPWSSFGRNSEQYQAPVADRTQREELHERCPQKGYR